MSLCMRWSFEASIKNWKNKREFDYSSGIVERKGKRLGGTCFALFCYGFFGIFVLLKDTRWTKEFLDRLLFILFFARRKEWWHGKLACCFWNFYIPPSLFILGMLFCIPFYVAVLWSRHPLYLDIIITIPSLQCTLSLFTPFSFSVYIRFQSSLAFFFLFILNNDIEDIHIAYTYVKYIYVTILRAATLSARLYTQKFYFVSLRDF